MINASGPDFSRYLNRMSTEGLRRPIGALKAGVRAEKVFERLGVRCIGDLSKVPASKWLDQPNFGARSLTAIESALAAMVESDESDPPDSEAEGVSADYLELRDIVAALSPSVQAVPLAELDLGVRVSGTLGRLGIRVVGDLKAYGDSMLLGEPNFGRGSFARLRSEIVRLEEVVHEPLDPNEFEIDLPHELVLLVRRAINDHITKPIHARVLAERLGLDGPQPTLDQLGQELGLTRERIRQIQNSSIQKLLGATAIEADLREHLRPLMAATTPAYLDVLAEKDRFFDEIDDYPHVLDALLEASGTGWHLVELRKEGVAFVSTVDKRTVEDTLNSARRLLRAAPPITTTATSIAGAVRDIVRPACDDDAVLEQVIADVLVEETTSVSTTADGEIVVGSGRTARPAVRLVLRASAAPLHYTEIAARVWQLGVQVGERRIHHAAAEVGYLYGRGTFGLRSHMPMSDSEMRAIADFCERHMAGNSQHQYNCHRLVEALRRTEEWADDLRLTHYVVDICLDVYAIASTSRKRGVWQSTGRRDDASSEDRLNLYELAVQALEKAGRCLSTVEILEQISVERDVKPGYQIQERGELVRVGRSLWDLKSRASPDDLLGSK